MNSSCACITAALIKCGSTIINIDLTITCNDGRKRIIFAGIGMIKDNTPITSAQYQIIGK